MKDLVQIWNHVANRRYSAVNVSEKELSDLSHNRLKKGDIDKSTFEVNFAECEGLNSKFNDEIDFNDRKDAIINRLFERRKKGQLTRQPKCLFMLLMLGFFSLSAGFFILFLHPYDFLFRQKVLLQDGGEIFEMWRKPEVDLYTRIYLFNVTNAEEYMDGTDTKLKLKEIGPYVYRESLEHEIVSFNENATLSAIPRHPLTWVEELSEGNKEDDMVYLPHIALLSIANVVSKESVFTRFGLNNLITLTNSKPLTKMTAREFMMGYKSELLTLGNTFLPGWIYFDKLGLIDRMYDFNGDYETIFTGEDDIRNAGLIDTYRGSTDLPQWEGKHCSNVQYASDGTKFRSGMDKNESLLFYRKSLCRAAPLITTEEGERSGLKAYKYTFADNMLDNGKYDEDNKCFCRKGKCLPNGLADVTDCYYGFPIALSYPHFYQGDDILFSKVEGLKPDKEQHETRFWIQPESGLPLDVSVKFQINMALGDISNIKNSERFSNMYLPLLWFDIRMYTLPPSLEQRFNVYLNILPVAEQAAMYILFITGAGLVLLTIYILTFKVMFKSFDKRQRNFDAWMEEGNNKPCNKDGIYAPCEVPLRDNESYGEFNAEKGQTIFGDLKDLTHKLTDKMYDTVGSVKNKVYGEIDHVKNVFIEKRNSDKTNMESLANKAYKSDSGDDRRDFKIYDSIKQADSDDDYKYLEVVDDGSEFDTPNSFRSCNNSEKHKESDSRNRESIIHLSD